MPPQGIDVHLTVAMRVLETLGVAPYNGYTMKVLEAKHMFRPPPSMPTTLLSKAPIQDEVNIIFMCIKSFPKMTSYGRDGLQAQHMLDALCGKGFVVGRYHLYAITLVVNLWMRERCLMSLAEFVASTPLTLLLKPNE